MKTIQVLLLLITINLVTALDQTTPISVAEELQVMLKEERYDDVLKLMAPIDLLMEYKLLSSDGDLDEYSSSLENLNSVMPKYRKLLVDNGFSFLDGEFKNGDNSESSKNPKVIVCPWVKYTHGRVKIREFIDRLYKIDGKWYIYELVDSRYFK